MDFDFDNMDLRSALDEEAYGIMAQGDKDLVFGGSSKQEAETFGAEIGKSDGMRVGAFLGGVALANMKKQEQRAARLARIRDMQKEILERQKMELYQEQHRETVRSNRANEGLKNSEKEITAHYYEGLLHNGEVKNSITERNNKRDNATAEKVAQMRFGDGSALMMQAEAAAKQAAAQAAKGGSSGENQGVNLSKEAKVSEGRRLVRQNLKLALKFFGVQSVEDLDDGDLMNAYEQRELWSKPASGSATALSSTSPPQAAAKQAPAEQAAAKQAETPPPSTQTGFPPSKKAGFGALKEIAKNMRQEGVTVSQEQMEELLLQAEKEGLLNKFKKSNNISGRSVLELSKEGKTQLFDFLIEL